MDQYENQEKSIQPLLVPQEMELTNDEINLINDNKEIFEKLGFEIEEFGGKSFVIHSVPSCLAGEDLDTVIKGVLDDIKNQKSPSNMQGRIEEILTYMSCRSAIKFGQSLSLEEMQALIDQTQKLKRPFTCPHGRPTMISLSLSELEKMFGRK
jgi:DNA mismatch repair protein MutL